MLLYDLLFKLYYGILNIDFGFPLFNKIKYKLLTYFEIVARFYLKRYLVNQNKNKIRKNDVSKDRKIIISLTTFPARINIVSLVIESIFLQSIKPDKIVLWLAKDEFNSKNKLPQRLLEQEKRGLDIRFCENLKPHKKYYYSIKENPNDIIITVDDDVFYPPFLLKKLMKLHNKNPNCIVCTRGHYITFNKNGKVKPYKEWIPLKENRPVEPSKLVLPTGVGGVLYPPSSLHEEVFNKQNIYELCLNADDLWLKIMSLKNNTKVVITEDNFYKFITIDKIQEEALSYNNVIDNENDEQLKNILSFYNYKISKENIKWSK